MSFSLKNIIIIFFILPAQEDIKSLSTHVVENFGQTVDKVLYVNTFKALRQKYEQQQDRLRTDRSQAPLEKYVSSDYSEITIFGTTMLSGTPGPRSRVPDYIDVLFGTHRVLQNIYFGSRVPGPRNQVPNSLC